MKINRILSSTTTFFALLILLNCTGGSAGNIAIPSNPDNPPPTPPQIHLINESIINPSGGSINLDWFTIDFPEGSLICPAVIKLYETVLLKPHDGILVGGKPLKLSIEPAPDPSRIHHAEENIISDGTSYTCTFHLDRLPAGLGDFSPANQYIDITGEWFNAKELHTANAWANRENNLIAHTSRLQNITLALIDYSNIPELTSQAIFTDDPRKISSPYARFAQGLSFDPHNLGPVCTRTPIIFIHGLNLGNALTEPANLSDSEATYADGGWYNLIDLINSSDGKPYYRDFKYFWFCYPTGQHIFGPTGSGAKLADMLKSWAETNNDQSLLTKPVIIVCHSEGGLVAREYLQHYGGNVAKIFSICTPHYGSPIVNIIYDGGIGPFYQDAQTELLKTPGILELACNDPVEYTGPFKSGTAALNNPGLASLNEG
jgi:pimeloyl-ACP methyl ester carboxylesterase